MGPVAPGGGGGVRTPVMSRQASLGRPRSTRSMSTVDPHGYVGRIIWRWYPDEDENLPWVEGFITDYDPSSQTYSILYDPHHPEQKETTETGFSFDTANPVSLKPCQ